MSSEILEEVRDFVQIWWASFREESTGRLRPAGGTGVSDTHGITGVDYAPLTAWAKGNSVSTDQHTIHDFVEYFEMLFNRMKEYVVRKDVEGKATGVAGLYYRDFTRKGQLVAGRGSRKYSVGSPTDKAEKVEVLTCRLLEPTCWNFILMAQLVLLTGNQQLLMNFKPQIGNVCTTTKPSFEAVALFIS